jgi:hypothetical protein
MPTTAHRGLLPVQLLAVLLALIGSLLLVPTPNAAADATATARVDTGRVRGNILGSDGSPSRVKVAWFTRDWQFIGRRSANGGVYTLDLAPGTYWLQFTDQRPAYNLGKYAPADIKVTVRAGHSTFKDVHMRRGAAITGTVEVGGHAGRHARIVAATAAEQSFSVVANKKGEFALGGLPAGSYSVFTYDHGRRWVGRSTWVPGLDLGRAENVAIRLDQPAGGLLVDLYGGSTALGTRVWVTAVSMKTGQFWTARSGGGQVRFDGLYPGRYRLVMPSAGNYLGRTGRVTGGDVHPGRVAFGEFRLTRRGGWVEGVVVDKEAPDYALQGVQVSLYDRFGSRVASTTTNDGGYYRLGGPLLTQDGMAVVVEPPNGGWMQGEHWCHFGRAEVDDVGVYVGQGTELDDVLLPHLPEAQQNGAVACYPSDGS